ncbi:radical SAM protein [candidate division KSB1 bacterium]|nr:radical SAM protein [candidate division KSB1 bacterium]
MKKMRILLIMPDARIHRLKIGPLVSSFREAPLTLTTLAALIPDDISSRVWVVDESVDRVPWHHSFDLVAISCLTGTAPRAYAIAHHFRQKGAVIVLGGVHVTLRPDEAAQHSDTIVIGDAERSWPKLLHDFQHHRLKSRYEDHGPSLASYPVARRDLQKRFGYMSPNTVFATRGCKNRCDFCTVASLPSTWQTRPVHEVIDEIRSIRSRRIVFNDVSLLEDREYAKELFTALVPLRKKWGGLCTAEIVRDDEMLELMHASGCIYLLIGLESFSRDNLVRIAKGFNRPAEYQELMTKLHAKNIVVQGCFIFGFDDDTPEIFDQTLDTVNDLKIDIPRYAIYTPYPGTPAFDRLDAENRLLHTKWQYYDTQHVVFQPKQMSAKELDNGFRRIYTRTFSIPSITKRTLGTGKYFPITFMGNLAYKRYIKRLQNDLDRFPFHRSVSVTESTHAESQISTGCTL